MKVGGMEIKVGGTGVKVGGWVGYGWGMGD